MGAMPVLGSGGEMGHEPGSSLGAGAASSGSSQLLGHPDVGAPGMGHPWELQVWDIPGIWGHCCPCFPFVLGPVGCGGKTWTTRFWGSEALAGDLRMLGGEGWLYAGLKRNCSWDNCAGGLVGNSQAGLHPWGLQGCSVVSQLSAFRADPSPLCLIWVLTHVGKLRQQHVQPLSP